MRTSKKILGVVLALMMLLNVVALGAYAMPADTIIELSLVADKDSYAAGDEVTLTVYAQTSATVPSVEMMGQYVWNYDSAIFSTLATTNVPGDHGFAPADSQASAYDASMSEAWITETLEGLGEAADDGDSMFAFAISESADAYVDSNAAPVALFSFKMKINDGVPDGDYNINWNASSYADYTAFVTDSVAAGIYGDVVTDFFPSATETTMWSLLPVTIHVGATGPKVAFSKASAKLVVKNGALDTTEGVKNVQMMVKSVITDADFDTYFFNTKTVGNADTAANENKIKDVGIVAFKGAAADFNEETAKGVVAGTAAANYEAARTDYISKASDSADAYFGAIIKGTWEGTFKNNDIVFLGFVEYYDAAGDVQVIFYETSVTKTITQSWVDANISNF